MMEVCEAKVIHQKRVLFTSNIQKPYSAWSNIRDEFLEAVSWNNRNIGNEHSSSIQGGKKFLFFSLFRIWLKFYSLVLFPFHWIYQDGLLPSCFIYVHCLIWGVSLSFPFKLWSGMQISFHFGDIRIHCIYKISILFGSNTPIWLNYL